MEEVLAHPETLPSKIADISGLIETALEGILSNPAAGSTKLIMTINQVLRDNPNYKQLLEKVETRVQQDKERLRSPGFSWRDPEIMENIQFRKDMIRILGLVSLEPLAPAILLDSLLKLVDVSYISMVLRIPNFDYGQRWYDETLRFQSFLIRFFINHHLLRDLSNFQKIDVVELQNSDPILRHRLRSLPRNDPKFMAKYYNAEFDLTQFTHYVLATYIHSVTWRWIGSDMFTHFEVLRLVKILFEYGLVTGDGEMKSLLKILMKKMENLEALERALELDNTSAAPHVQLYISFSTEARTYMMEALAHALVWELDREYVKLVQKALPLRQGGFSEQFAKENFKFAINEERLGVYQFIMSKYCLSLNKIKTQSLIHIRALPYFYTVLDIYNKNIVNPWEFSFRWINWQHIDGLLNPIDAESAGEFAELQAINNELLTVLSNARHGEFLGEDGSLNIALIYHLAKLNKEFDDSEKEMKYKIMMIDTSIYKTLIHLLYFFRDSLSVNNVQRIVKTLGTFGMNSPTCQGLLLNNIRKLVFVQAKFPTFIVDLFQQVFEQNSLILLENDVFDIFLEAFKNLVLQEVNTFTTENFYVVGSWCRFLKRFFNYPDHTPRKFIHEISLLKILIPALVKILAALPDINYYEPVLLFQQPLYQECSKNSIPPGSMPFYTVNLMLSMMDLFNAAGYYALPTITEIQLAVLKKLSTQFMPIFKDLSDKVILLEFLTNCRLCYYLKQATYTTLDSNFPCPPEKRMNREEIAELTDFVSYALVTFFGEISFQDEEERKQKKMYWEKGIIPLLRSFFLNFTTTDDLIRAYNTKLSNALKERILDLLLLVFEKRKEIEDLGQYWDLDTQLSATSAISKNLSALEGQRKENLKIGNIGHLGLEMLRVFNSLTPYRREPMLNENSLIPNIDTFEQKLRKRYRVVSKAQEAEFFGDKLFFPVWKSLQQSVADGFDDLFASFAQFLESPTATANGANLNVVHFLHAFLTKAQETFVVNRRYHNSLAYLTLLLSWAPIHFQGTIFQIMSMDEANKESLNLLYAELKRLNHMMIFKFPRNKFWRRNMLDNILITRYFQQLVICDNQPFKTLMREHSPALRRVVVMLTNLEAIMTASHLDKSPGTAWLEEERPELVHIMANQFNVLGELMIGPCPGNQKQISRYDYDRFNKILARDVKDIDSPYYDVKVALINYLSSMADGLEPEVVTYQTSNLDPVRMLNCIGNSLRALYYTMILQKPHWDQDIKPYDYSDYEKLSAGYRENKNMSRHKIMVFCSKLFIWINHIAKIHEGYKKFVTSRRNCTEKFRNRTLTTFPEEITLEEMVIFTFFDDNVTTVDYISSPGQDCRYESIDFLVYPECKALPSRVKHEFLESQDITNSKENILTSFVSKLDSFSKEMESCYQTKGNMSEKEKGMSQFVERILPFLIIDLIFVTTTDQALLSILAILQIIGLSYYLPKLARKLGYNHEVNQEIAKVAPAKKKYLYLPTAILTTVKKKDLMLYYGHILVSLLGLLIHKGFFGLYFPLPLIFLPDIQYLWKAVKISGKRLALTFLCWVTLLYSFFVLTEVIARIQPSGSCSSITECLVVFFSLDESPTKRGSATQFLLIITFSILTIFILMLNSLYAILVPTFTEVKNKAKRHAQELETRCFVCGLTKEEKEAAKEDFTQYRNTRHNLWNYLYLYYKVAHTPKKSVNCHELWILSNFMTQNTAIFPANRTEKFTKTEDPPFLKDIKSKVYAIDDWKSKLQQWAETFSTSQTKSNTDNDKKLADIVKELTEMKTKQETLQQKVNDTAFTPEAKQHLESVPGKLDELLLGVAILKSQFAIEPEIKPEEKEPEKTEETMMPLPNE